MGYVIKRVYLYHEVGTGSWNSTVDEDLSDEAYDLSVNKGVSATKDTFSFKIAKSSRYFSPSIRIVAGDLVKIWITRDAAITDSDLLIVGVVNNTSYAEGDNVVSVSGNDFSEKMFDFQMVVGEFNKTVPDMLTGKFLLGHESIVGSGITFTLGDSIPEYKSDDSTSFPKHNLSLNYTPMFQIIDKLASNKYTEDGQYYWYVDTDKVFHFVHKGSTPETTVIDPRTTDIEDIKISKKNSEVKNFIVYQYGTDLKGNSLEDVNYSDVSIAKYGYKYYFAVEDTVKCFDDIISNEIDGYKLLGTLQASWGSDVVDTTTGEWVNNQTYPTPGNNPIAGGNTYVFIQKDKDGNTLTATSNSEFNTYAGQLAQEMAERITDDMISNSDLPKYKVDLTFPFRTDLILGGLYQVTIPKRAIDDQLRLVDLSYDLNGVSATFDQDLGSAEVIS